MAKYSKEKANECAAWVQKNGLIEYGGARLRDFCQFAGISQETYYQWLQKAEFADAIKKAKEEFRAHLEVRLVKSLARTAEGYEWKQVTTEYVADGEAGLKIKKETTKNVREAPNVGAAIFLLTNLAPGRWQNRRDGNPPVFGNTPNGDNIHKIIFQNFKDE